MDRSRWHTPTYACIGCLCRCGVFLRPSEDELGVRVTTVRIQQVNLRATTNCFVFVGRSGVGIWLCFRWFLKFWVLVDISPLDPACFCNKVGGLIGSVERPYKTSRETKLCRVTSLDTHNHTHSLTCVHIPPPPTPR